MTTIEQAVAYLNLGLSVIPIQPGKKIPTMAWKAFQERPMTHEEAGQYFKEGDNIALVCGDVSGVLVVDQDDYKEKVGVQTDSPLVVTTPRGGKHLYFRYKEGTGNTANASLATDIRSKGGYVLVPPSKVQLEDGTMKAYEWNIEPSKALLAALPQATDDVLKKIYNTPEPQAVPSPLNVFDVNRGIGISEGGRNDTLHRAALSLLAKHDENTAWNLLEGMNLTCNPPLPGRELQSLFNSALKRFREVPPQRTTSVAPVVENPEYRPTTANDDLEGAIALFKKGKKQGISTGFTELDRIVGGLIPGQSYLMYADTNVGKSVFAVNVLVDLARRGIKTMYFDLENSMDMTVERLMLVANRGSITLDDWRRATKDKDEDFIDKAMEPVKSIFQNLTVWDLHKLDDRFGDITWEGVKRCVDEGVKNDVKVIILDHLHYFSPKETDHGVLGDVAREMNNIAATENVAFVLIAHTKKGLVYSTNKDEVKVKRPTVDDVNGSSLISKHFKNLIAIQRNTAAVDMAERVETIVYVDKTKFGPTGSFKLQYDEQSLVFVGENQLDNEHNKTYAAQMALAQKEAEEMWNSTPDEESEKVPF